MVARSFSDSNCATMWLMTKNTQQLSLLAAKRRPARRRQKNETKTAVRSPLLRLSPTTGLNLFRECPRCFYLHHARGVHRPRGIFPSLPSGMDLVIKDYFDRFRGALPPELVGKVDATLFSDKGLLDQWRNWRTGLEYHDERRNAVLFGALDDCLVADGLYIPLDYKTKGSPPGAGDGERYYQTQLDAYALLLQENGFPVAPYAYLVYYYPREVQEGGFVAFHVQPIRVATDPERVRALFERAVKLLRGSEIPQRHTNCEYCAWNEDRSEFD